MEAFDAGEYRQARKLFRRLDPTQLPDRQQRVELFRALQQIDRELHPEAAREATQPADGAPAEPADADADADAEAGDEPEAPAQPEPSADEAEAPAGPQDWLQQARRAADRDLGEAASIYQKILGSDEAGDQLKRQAEAELAQVRRLQTPGRQTTEELISAAAEAIEAGNYRQAKASLDQIEQTDAELGWFDQQRVKRQRATIQQNLGPQIAAGEDQPAEGDQPTPPEPGDQPEPGDDEPTIPDPADVAQADGDQEPAEPQPGDEMAEDQPADGDQPQPGDQEPQDQQPDQEPAEPSSDLLVQARQAYIDKLTEEARTAMNEGQYNVAVKRYERALEINPESDQLQQQLQQARSALAQESGEGGLIEQEREVTRARIEQAVAAFNDAMARARRQLEARQYDQAQAAVEEAKLVLERQASLLSTDRYERLDSEATQLSATIDEDKAAWQKYQAQQQEKEAQRAERKQRQRRQRQQEQEIQKLLKRAQQLRKDMQYTQAEDLVDQALFKDPNNLAAQAMKELIQQGKLMKNARQAERRKDVLRTWHNVKNIEAATPYKGLMNYPDNWPQLSQRRWDSMDGQGGESEANQRVRQALSEPVPVNFENENLSSAIGYLRNFTDQNFFVNWSALNQIDVTRDTPINLTLSDVPASQALDLVLKQATGGQAGGGGFGGPAASADWSIIRGVVHVSSQSDLETSTATRVYDIRDLLVQVPSFSNAPEFDLRSALQSSGTGDNGGGGDDFGGGGGDDGGGIFGGDEDEEDEDEPEQMTRQEMIDEITSLIQDSVGQPEDWGQTASSSLRELNGNLIVRTTSNNHQQVQQLLAQLRDTRAVQISVQARFLMVSDEFLEDIAVDLDLQLDSSALPEEFGDISVGQDHESLAGPPTETASEIAPGAGGMGTGSFSPGTGFAGTGRSMDISASFVDNLSANLLVRATQVDRKSLSLTAPRITFFNGQRAYVIVARQQTFVSDLEPVPDAVGFDPELSVIQSGVVLDVEGTVSADRRYVTLTVRPSLAEVIDIVEFEFGGVGVVDGGDGGDGDGGGNIVEANQVIQQPELELTSLRSTVSIPDQGTLLMGGQRIVDEFEREAGVPVLSKLPIVNRVFTNNSQLKDERTLLILIKPQIIIQNEEENERFPELQGMNPNR
jgi:type II secretory pathway component GspD/PulD (secretin)